MNLLETGIMEIGNRISEELTGNWNFAAAKHSKDGHMSRKEE